MQHRANCISSPYSDAYIPHLAQVVATFSTQHSLYATTGMYQLQCWSNLMAFAEGPTSGTQVLLALLYMGLCNVVA